MRAQLQARAAGGCGILPQSVWAAFSRLSESSAGLERPFRRTAVGKAQPLGWTARNLELVHHQILKKLWCSENPLLCFLRHTTKLLRCLLPFVRQTTRFAHSATSFPRCRLKLYQRTTILPQKTHEAPPTNAELPSWHHDVPSSTNELHSVCLEVRSDEAVCGRPRPTLGFRLSPFCLQSRREWAVSDRDEDLRKMLPASDATKGIRCLIEGEDGVDHGLHF